MTTPPTPAGWYPDPDGSGGQRYWDGSTWTEHRSPAVAAPAPVEEPAAEFPASEQATSVVSLPDQPTTAVPTRSAPPPTTEPEDRGVGAHRAPDPEPEPEPEPVIPPVAPIAPSYETPSYATPSAFAGPPGPPEPPFGSDGSGGAPNNRNLIIGFLSAVGVLVVVLVLAAVYGFVIRDTETQVASPGASTSSSKTTTSSESSGTGTASETATASPTPGPGGEATQGDFVFSVASTDRGDTVSSPINEYIEKTATGEFIVVYLNVGNTGTGPLTFLSTLQVLNTDTGTFVPDDEASFYLGGGVVTINPGEQLETALAFDVPVGATPVSILVHGEPVGPAVDLPL
ncbi:MAG: hypothetical protein QOF25_3604 [Mycobacterium sp.]|nr:hypothetical protein [Mycobacterium sp.]